MKLFYLFYFFLISFFCLAPSYLLAAPEEQVEISIRYATGFTVERRAGYTLVEVNTPWLGAKTGFCYILKEKDKSISDNFAGKPAWLEQIGQPQRTMKGGRCGMGRSNCHRSDKNRNCQVVYIPVQRLVSLSTTHLAFLDALNLVDRLVGVSSPERVFTPSVRHAIQQGKIKGVGSGPSLRVESILELAPDLILTYGSGSFRDAHPKLLEAGLKVAVNAEYMESHPLGRAEWIKFIALFFGKEQKAELLFTEIEARYLALVKLAADVERRPTVLTNTPFHGRWHVARGDSYMARYLKDSGADYIWADIRGAGSIPMDIEMVYERGHDAEYWINTGTWTSLEQARTSAPRMVGFRSLKAGKLYNRDKRTNEQGGNDYWESGMMHPDLVLADLIRIFHPELLADHELYYYRKLQ